MSFDPALEREYNRTAVIEIENIRDFLILHYHATQRDDGELWKYCRNMSLPDSLAYKMEVFRARGRPIVYEADGFKEANWIAIYNGLGVVPKAYDTLVDRMSLEDIRRMMAERKAVLRRGVETMPTQEQFINMYFRSENSRVS